MVKFIKLLYQYNLYMYINYYEYIVKSM